MWKGGQACLSSAAHDAGANNSIAQTGSEWEQLRALAAAQRPLDAALQC